MNLLLDTCTFLWMCHDQEKISVGARDALIEPGNTLFLSAASSCEIAIKWMMKKLKLPKPPIEFIPAQRKKLDVTQLPILEREALRLGELPFLQTDPFDRILICQAQEHKLAIVTPDKKFCEYDVKVLW